MAIWFKIKKGKLEAYPQDELWFIKKIWYTLTFRKYYRQYMYRLECEVDNSGILKKGDIFVAGTENPPIYFQITNKSGYRDITAVSVNTGFKNTIDNIGGLSVVVKSNYRNK